MGMAHTLTPAHQKRKLVALGAGSAYVQRCAVVRAHTNHLSVFNGDYMYAASVAATAGGAEFSVSKLHSHTLLQKY